MNEDAGIVFMILFWATLAIAAYQRLWTIRRLRKKVDRHVEEALAAARMPAPVAAPAPAEDFRRVEERLQVLERITVDKENSLSRQIDDLRAASA
jgi:hypothetical protein